jgi:hypothetical protein
MIAFLPFNFLDSDHRLPQSLGEKKTENIFLALVSLGTRRVRGLKMTSPNPKYS